MLKHQVPYRITVVLRDSDFGKCAAHVGSRSSSDTPASTYNLEFCGLVYQILQEEGRHEVAGMRLPGNNILETALEI